MPRPNPEEFEALDEQEEKPVVKKDTRPGWLKATDTYKQFLLGSDSKESLKEWEAMSGPGRFMVMAKVLVLGVLGIGDLYRLGVQILVELRNLHTDHIAMGEEFADLLGGTEQQEEPPSQEAKPAPKPPEATPSAPERGPKGRFQKRTAAPAQGG